MASPLSSLLALWQIISALHVLHGNPLGAKPLYKGSKVSLFWLAPSLYRLALTGFLDMPPVSMKRGQFHA